jgi:hypothetical protein
MNGQRPVGDILIDLADEAIAADEGIVEPGALLENMVRLASQAGDLDLAGIGRLPRPATLFDAFTYPCYTAARQQLERVFQVVAAPGGPLTVLLQPGDILVRRGLGEGSLGHIAFIAAPARPGTRQRVVARRIPARTLRLCRGGRTTAAPAARSLRTPDAGRAWVGMSSTAAPAGMAIPVRTGIGSITRYCCAGMGGRRQRGHCGWYGRPRTSPPLRRARRDGTCGGATSRTIAARHASIRMRRHTGAHGPARPAIRRSSTWRSQMPGCIRCRCGGHV